jgi:putative SOS response-associated peptidase YedK
MNGSAMLSQSGRTTSTGETANQWLSRDCGETWNGNDQVTGSCSIITTAANDMMTELHDRMPVILNPEDFDWWMTGNTEEVRQLLAPCPSKDLDAYPISQQVNNPPNEGPEILEPVSEDT